MVNILSWNVRGLNTPNKQKETKLLCNDEKVGMIGLLETKIKKDRIEQIAGKLFSGWQIKRYFKYCNAWAQHPQFNQIVSYVWTTFVEGCKMFQIVKKMKLLKRKLRELNSQYFSNIEQTTKVDRQALKQEEHEKYQKFKESSNLAEMFLQQKSKATWLRLGDDNTGYFYSVIRHKRLKLATIQLKDDQGVWQTEPEAIVDLFLSYYQELLGQKASSRRRAYKGFIQNGSLLTTELQLRLLQPIEEKEVKKELF
ncbi:uncharacterized protein [Nicotiana sylvestris]|uniref:uncharacterized protein n=1 Tax=Nicotiana sylvestris TaxID=4096 RepID=UPI00388C39B1